MTQPEALRLAEILEGGSRQFNAEAATELRRLHDDYENALKHFAEAVDGYKQMAAQRDELLEALKNLDANPDMLSAWLQARDAIAKAQQ